MENEMDVFSEGWSGESMRNDERDAETLPEDGGESGGDNVAGDSVAETFGEGERDEIDREFERFVQRFPDVRGEDIPRQVWESVRRGERLTEAYLMYETGRLREENLGLRQTRERRELNISRSAGSQTDSGSGGVRMDAFEEGWEME